MFKNLKLNKFLLLVTLMVFSGCETVPSSASFPPNSLAGNEDIPYEILRPFYDAEQWLEMRKMPYDGYVVLEGTVQRDRSVEIKRILESHPNTQRDELALIFSKGIESGSISTGTRIKSTVKVYVVFYETNMFPRKALVFSKLKPLASPQSSIGRDVYLKFWTY